VWLLHWFSRPRGGPRDGNSSRPTDDLAEIRRDLVELNAAQHRILEQSVDAQGRLLAIDEMLATDTQTRRAAERRADMDARRDGVRGARQLLFCLIAFAVAIMCGWLAYPAFVDPSPNRFIPGTAHVALEPLAGETEEEVPSVELTVTTAEAPEPGVSYEMDFPPRAIGRHFALMLAGSAVPASLPGDPQLKIRRQRCTDQATPGECVLIEGIVTDPDPFTTHRTSGCPAARGMKTRISVTVRGPAQTEGSAQLVSSPNLYHHITSLPDTRDQVDGAAIDGFSGMIFDQTLVEARQTVCQIVSLNPHWQSHETSSSPTFESPSTLMWSPQSPFEVISVTSRNRSAIAIGTILLAAAGTLAGLAFTFLPGAFDNRRRYRQSRRAQHPAKPAKS
jgi:hypothetical protein